MKSTERDTESIVARRRGSSLAATGKFLNSLPKRALVCGLLLLFALFAALLRMAGQRGPEPKVRLLFRIEHRVGDKPLRLDDVSLRSQEGDLLSVSRLAYLISDVTFLRADGSAVTPGGQFAYINPEEARQEFAVENVPKGRYVGISFTIGLDPETNHTDPAVWSAEHPLNPMVNHLHWSWQGGYVFLALEGRYETPGTTLGGYSYHLATDKRRMRITLRGDLSLQAGNEVRLGFDVARVLHGRHPLSLREPGGNSTHSAEGDDLARHLAENAESAFSLEGVGKYADTANLPALETTPAPPGTTPYTLPIPAHFMRPNLPADNPLTREGVALGKRLFFDKRLSGNNTQSCASCHQADSGFVDRGKALSRGILGKKGTRNAMPLFNLAWSRNYTWDGRRTRLRDQALAPIQDKHEMNQTLTETEAKIQTDSAYSLQFRRAFGSAGVTAERVGLAIEQYLLTLLATNAKFDRYLRDRKGFTREEKRGLDLFITEYDPARKRFGADCFHCHGGNLFVSAAFTNNGLDGIAKDTGRERVTGRRADRGKFKTPSLRNVALTAPYMHDGRFRTLEEVVEHYNSGVHRSETLDPNLAKHPDSGLKLSAADKRALIAFLKTLTDRPALP